MVARGPKSQADWQMREGSGEEGRGGEGRVWWGSKAGTGSECWPVRSQI